MEGCQPATSSYPPSPAPLPRLFLFREARSYACDSRIRIPSWMGNLEKCAPFFTSGQVQAWPSSLRPAWRFDFGAIQTISGNPEGPVSIGGGGVLGPQEFFHYGWSNTHGVPHILPIDSFKSPFFHKMEAILSRLPSTFGLGRPLSKFYGILKLNFMKIVRSDLKKKWGLSVAKYSLPFRLAFWNGGYR